MTEKQIAWLKPPMIEDMKTAAYDASQSVNADRNEAIIQLFSDTGLRVTELVDLQPVHFNPDDKSLFLPSEIQKQYPNGGKPSPVTLGLQNETVRLLRRYMDTDERIDGYLFPSHRSDQITKRSVRNVVKKIADEAAVEPRVLDEKTGWYDGEPDDVSTHTFRHSVAYRMLEVEDGHDIYDVSRRLRHKKLQTTIDTYSHFETV